MALAVENLSVARGGLPLLAGVHFRVAAGQALILRGPNGSGKTTLLRSIAGLQKPTSGRVECAEDAIAYAAHSDGLKSNLTVSENLAFWADVFGNDDISPALEGFDLKSLSDRPAHALSAGQKRRLGLARLLVTGRPIWVLDEPTVSLDQTFVAMFADVVKSHLAGGGSALIATHIDLGIEAETLDISVFKTDPTADLGAFDEAFL
ncbi:heme ABC exporter ATP-binding protein CcmA [Cognatishimia activa]|uniref:Cytochrome c biogenesis ATP-binding export protein CcmA n=1 Tax=Cognatishimia activa TaxID=1715691 RepID=A0A0P1ITP8_9RHOB|nr:heme ABC exporter ATP-binding protein CcmA [Cognatishimia activa]CUI80165.1 Cytochrome c biogenesis ATP-binding export protein CcmA [Cognatishimia activa]CUK26867.1 Cytochrome c biogenesis ATP-binding export protein CcmA [Cognatishimia activa]